MELIYAANDIAIYKMLVADTRYTVIAGIVNDCGSGNNGCRVRAVECGYDFVPMRVFPNPAENSLQFAFENGASKEAFSYQISNSYGVVLLSGENQTGEPLTIDISTLTKGIYYVRITTPKGVIVKRVVVER